MAKRLIDGNSFVLEELLRRDKTEYLNTFVDGVRAVMKAIRTAPTVDAVEVTRCKDCEYFKTLPEDGYNVCLHVEKGMVCPEPTDFCSYGERKEKENNNG